MAKHKILTPVSRTPVDIDKATTEMLGIPLEKEIQIFSSTFFRNVINSKNFLLFSISFIQVRNVKNNTIFFKSSFVSRIVGIVLLNNVINDE